MRRRRVAALAVVALSALVVAPAAAFRHVVQRGDTLASIAEHYYGRIQHEKLLVAANGLEAQGGAAIVPGLPLEVPALGHRRTQAGDTWASLATQLLGGAQRAEVLAAANGTSPWLPPAPGTEIAVPYNLPVVASSTDTLITIAYRFLGDMNKAWVLDHYNGLAGRRVLRGDVVLVPLTDLTLTEAGRQAARAAAGATCGEAAGESRALQRRVAAEVPQLVAEVRRGRYVEAVAHGNRMLTGAQLAEGDLGRVHRLLLEAHAALGATGLAAESCAAWRRVDPTATLDPVWMSPKLIAACGGAEAVAPAPAASGSARPAPG